MIFKGYKYYIVIIVLVIFTSCDQFEFSPYESLNLNENEMDLNSKNIDRITNSVIDNTDSFNFAIISDNHIEYDILEEVVNKINNDHAIRFVIHLGDMTDGGIYKEFHWTNEKMEKLNVPYIMVIGNHDYRSNGKLIYDKMYGPSSFTFTFNKIKFVCFDDIVWENNNSNPDFNWLDKNLADNQSYNQVFVFAHVPPYSDRFDVNSESEFNHILKSNNVKCSFNGHIHESYFKKYWKNSDTWYFSAAYLKARNYYKVCVTDSAFQIKTITF